MFLGLLDPDSLVRGPDSDPDPSIIKQKYSIPTGLLLLCDFLSLKNDAMYLKKVISVLKVNEQK
jgi:hypothetical protein